MKNDHPKSDHCFINLVLARFECRDCGETLGLSLPLEIKALSRLAEAFQLNHRKCGARVPAEGAR